MWCHSKHWTQDLLNRSHALYLLSYHTPHSSEKKQENNQCILIANQGFLKSRFDLWWWKFKRLSDSLGSGPQMVIVDRDRLHCISNKLIMRIITNSSPYIIKKESTSGLILEWNSDMFIQHLVILRNMLTEKCVVVYRHYFMLLALSCAHILQSCPEFWLVHETSTFRIL